MTIRAGQPGDWLFKFLPNKMTERQLAHWRNIWWRIALTWIPPRDSRFDFMREMGSPQIDNVLTNKPLKFGVQTDGGGQHILFVFPERHLTTQEEHIFVPSLWGHHQIVDATLTIIDIVTKSPLILGNFLADDVRIIKDEEDWETGLSNAHKQTQFADRKFGPILETAEA